MAKKEKISANEKRLMKRYFVWCYKTTKEELDRVDRYFTQSIVDQNILKELKKKILAVNGDEKGYQKLINEFEVYMERKTIKACENKYTNQSNRELQSGYLYTLNRFKAIEKSILKYFGKKGLDNIAALYEDEMTQRILQAREHN